MAEEQNTQLQILALLDKLSTKLDEVHIATDETQIQLEHLNQRVKALELQQEEQKKPAKKFTPPPKQRKNKPQRVEKPKAVETHHFQFGGFRIGDRIILKDRKKEDTPFGIINSFTTAGWARITLENGGNTNRRTNNIRKRK